MPSRLLKAAAFAIGLLSAGTANLSSPAHAAEKPVVVFAAASLRNVLTQIGEDWKAATGKETTFSFAASSALAKQVEQGAPADLFISADRKWMDYLDRQGLIDPAARRDIVGNRLVLVGPATAAPVEINDRLDLAKMLGEGRLAVGLTASVPAGIYARQSLERLGLWDQVSPRLAEAENVRAALLLVARGEAPLGVVYETDAKAEKNVKQLGIFPDDSHEPIVYPAALTREARTGDAADFLDYLQSPGASDVFQRAGFSLLKTQ